MKEKVLFRNTIETLLYSWGGDIPEEAIDTANDLLVWIKKEFNLVINIEFELDHDTGLVNSNEVLEVIEAL